MNFIYQAYNLLPRPYDPRPKHYDSRFNQFENNPSSSGSNSNSNSLIKDRPGKLSFSLGPLNFRQKVFDQQKFVANRSATPGNLSFKLGPISFIQTSTSQNYGYQACCVNKASTCFVSANCERRIRRRERKRLERKNRKRNS